MQNAANMLHQRILPREAKPSHYFPLREVSPPRLGLGNTWIRQLRSGSFHYPTTATKCNKQPSQATANPIGGKACSPIKGGLLCYVVNTYFTKFRVSNLHISGTQYAANTVYVAPMYSTKECYPVSL